MANNDVLPAGAPYPIIGIGVSAGGLVAWQQFLSQVSLRSGLARPPFTRLDFLSCRNLLIYLEPELLARLIELFHYSPNPGSVQEAGGGAARHASPACGADGAFKTRGYG